MVKLSPYSLEFNPIENLRYFLKSLYWANCVYENHDKLLEAIEQPWQKVCLDAATMKTVGHALYTEFAEFN